VRWDRRAHPKSAFLIRKRAFPRASRQVSGVPGADIPDRLFDDLVGAQQNRWRYGKAKRLGGLQVHETAQNRSTAPATALAAVALRAGDESICSSARLTIIPASKRTAGIRDSYSTARLS
jgi:hypothetical protein